MTSPSSSNIARVTFSSEENTVQVVRDCKGMQSGYAQRVMTAEFSFSRREPQLLMIGT